VTSPGALSVLVTPGRIATTVISGLAIEAGMIWRFGWRAPLAAYSLLAATGALVSATDLAARRVPNLIVWPAYTGSALLLVFASASSGLWWPLTRAGMAAAALGGFYLALGFAFPAGMGLGDVKWALVLGAYLGWLTWSTVITGTSIAFFAAAVVVVAMRAAGRRQSSLPMVPFMTLGAVAAVLATR
jgi:leader peptidase (prepilin peptidase)/N-methyltransferase